MANNKQDDWADVPQTPAAPKTTAGQGDWVDVPTTPTPAVSAPTPDRTAALTKATGLTAQPKPFSKQWLKEKAFQGAVGTAEALPAAESMTGAVLGGGTGMFTGGTTSVPGAFVGGTFGGAAGEAQKQLILRALGFPSPATSGQAAWDIGTQGLEQGALTLAGEKMTPAAKAIGIDPAGWLQRWAETEYARGLDPTNKVNKAIVDRIVPQLLKQRIWGSLRGLQQRGESTAAELMPQLDAAYAQWEKQLPQTGVTPAWISPSGMKGPVVGTFGQIPGAGTEILQDLDKLKAKSIVRGVVQNQGAVDAIDKIQNVIKQHGPDINPYDLRQIRQIYDEPVAAKGAFAIPDRATGYAIKAERAAGNSARDILNSAPTDIGTLDKRVSLMLNLKNVTKEAALNDVGQKGGLLKAAVKPGMVITAGLTGLYRGGVAGGAEYATYSSLLLLTYEVMRTTTFRTMASVQKSAIADALANGSVDRMVAAIGRTGMAAIEANKDFQARRKAMGLDAPSAGPNVNVTGPTP